MATPSCTMHLSTICRSFARTRTPSQRITPFSSPVIHRSATRTTTAPAVTHSALLHTSPPTHRKRQPLAHNREPVPDRPPPTDLGSMDVLAGAPVPATAVNTCFPDGFALSSGARILDGAGALLVGGEAFGWRPWDEKEKKLVNERGQWEVGVEAFGLLGLVWPRPDLLILGLGPEMRPLSPITRRVISSLGMRVEVLDTRNAAAQFNLLATERGIQDVAAALIPVGWKEGVGAV